MASEAAQIDAEAGRPVSPRRAILPGLRPALHFFAVMASIGVAVFASLVAFVMLVPEGNDYALAVVGKRERLETQSSPKVVLVGGSNLAYGINTQDMQTRIGCPVVNMGMNGYLGVRYMLNEVRHGLNAGDTVVVSFEWDNYFKPVVGSVEELIVILKLAPDTWNFLDWPQRLRILTDGLPSVAQQKASRLVGEAVAAMLPAVPSDSTDELDYILTIERFDGFNAEGDLVSHLDKTWPFVRGEGIDLTDNGIDPGVVDEIAGFAEDMRARGVNVAISYTPVMRSYYDKHATVIGQVHEALLATGVLSIARPPSDYVYEDDQFFDEAYHVGRAARQARTSQLAGDLVATRAEAASCGGGSDAP